MSENEADIRGVAAVFCGLFALIFINARYLWTAMEVASVRRSDGSCSSAAGRGRPAAQLRGTSCHGASRHSSGSRGSPRTRSASTFLFISVVPPSIVFARLRNIPATSYGRLSP